MAASRTPSRGGAKATKITQVSWREPRPAPLVLVFGPEEVCAERAIAGVRDYLPAEAPALEVPDGGTVRIGDEDVTYVPPQQRGIGFVFQHYAAFKHMTVRDNMGFGPSIRKQPKADIAKRVDELLEIVGLAG